MLCAGIYYTLMVMYDPCRPARWPPGLPGSAEEADSVHPD